ncbi:MAG TPA: hypothetical protein VMJ70_05535 [Candidatus Sulfotelmatobacter sp.]|nr:hypothetical protein [Candidatus Sulfotelmatobacter sp.]
MTSAPRSSASPAPALSPAPDTALRLACIALAALRVAAQFHPSMFAWGLNYGRFAAPPAWMTGLLLITLPLAPPVGRWLDDRLDHLSRIAGSRAGLAWALPAALAIAVTLALPDRTWFVGDFVLRAGIVREPGGFGRLFPQAQPLDVWLHYRLPHALLSLGLDSDVSARLLGSLEAVGIALLSVRLARGLRLDGAPAIAVVTTAAAGGYLALYTGYGKPTIEVALLTLAIGVLALELVRDGRGYLAIAIAFALALGLHRSALSLAPGVFIAFGLAMARRRGSRVEAGVALLVLAATLAWFVPRLWRLFVSFDASTNFTSPEVERQGGMLRAAMSGLRLLDLANLVVLFAPLALALPVLFAGLRRSRPAEEWLALLGLFTGFLPALLFVTVTQGPFRDWDANAAAGVALALLVAAGLAERLRSGARGMSTASALAVLVPTLLVMVSQNDLSRGLQRARAFLDERPARSESQQLATLDYLGLRELRLEHWEDAADAYGALAERAPHPRALVLHGTAALMAGRNADAERSFRTLIERDSSESVGWFGLWLSARRGGDSATAARAERVVLAYPDTSEQMSRILAHLQHYPKLWGLLPRTGWVGSAADRDSTSAGR